MTYRPATIKVVFIPSRNTYGTYAYVNGSRRCLYLNTTDKAEAEAAAQRLIGDLPVRAKANPADKAKLDPDLYIYERKPYEVKIGGKHVGFAMTRAEARRLRDEHLGI